MQYSGLTVLDLGRPLYPSLQNIMPGIEKTYSLKTEYFGVAPAPPKQSNKRKTQIDADWLLRYYSQSVTLPNRSLGLLLTDADLFVSIYNFIFGLAEPELGWAILSTFRLQDSPRRIYLARVKKEITHELGHLVGLGHCENKVCVMSFSNTVQEVDQKNTFLCPKCGRLLGSRIQ